jgi:hypothetical protein
VAIRPLTHLSGRLQCVGLFSEFQVLQKNCLRLLNRLLNPEPEVAEWFGSVSPDDARFECFLLI